MEIWKIIPETNELYEASNIGNVRRVVGEIRNNPNGGLRKVGGKVLSQKTKSNGYKELNLYILPQVSKMAYVHRLVVSAFFGKIKDGQEVNHKDGDKSNNSITNLEVVTPSENRIHAYHVLNKQIVRKRGSKHPMAKLTEDSVLKIRDLYKNGSTPKQLSAIFNVSHGAIAKICYRATWQHI